MNFTCSNDFNRACLQAALFSACKALCSEGVALCSECEIASEKPYKITTKMYTFSLSIGLAYIHYIPINQYTS